jgi:hypothetical protein
VERNANAGAHGRARAVERERRAHRLDDLAGDLQSVGCAMSVPSAQGAARSHPAATVLQIESETFKV